MNHNVASGHKKGDESDFGMYSGPIPPPDLLRHYSEIDPTFPDRIIKLAESEQQFRQSEDSKNNKTERAVLRSDAIIRFFIPIMASVVCLAIIALGGYAFYNKLEWGGAIVSVSFIAAILISFSKLMKQTRGNTPAKQGK